MKKGFTLLEILVVIGIMALLAVMSMSIFSGLTKAQAAEADARLITSLIDQARGDTLSSKNATQYGMYIGSTTVTYFVGSSYNPNASSNKVYPFSGRSVITLSLSGGGNDIIFARLTGEVSRSGTITITAGDKTKVITLYTTGATSVQ